jgi:hypothetical protein
MWSPARTRDHGVFAAHHGNATMLLARGLTVFALASLGLAFHFQKALLTTGSTTEHLKEVHFHRKLCLKLLRFFKVFKIESGAIPSKNLLF